ncbi:hypothetical protein [Streptomyces sp. H27-H5]|uniref:hypothetical protein n=1 Tax=Streptomyces sp. H27-H5 TaxID=2996460 RepID=UPI002271327B|nr:hypothetical protein [Streptomyces sp. H27-H5]MCY0962611.1 hypothetical protein [Streptomyces sp. H27-H5]
MANRNNNRPRRTDLERRPPQTVRADREDDYEATPAEAQESEALGHYVTVTLVDEDVRVIPPGAWRQSWQQKLQQGLTDEFAELVIHPDDLDLYYDIDPTNDEFGDFVGAAARMSGESLGKSRGPAASSRRTRRR